MIFIFDLDGTLLNTIDDLGYACNYALSENGYHTHYIEEYKQMVGNGINCLIRRALPDNARTDNNVLRLRQYFTSYYNLHNTDYTKPYDGIIQLLDNLKNQGHKLAVASNKYNQATQTLINHYFPGIFDVVFGEREGIERKPDPTIVNDIRRLLPGEAVYIGDSLVDMQTAQNAHLPFIACSWGFVQREILTAAGINNIADKAEDIATFAGVRFLP